MAENEVPPHPPQHTNTRRPTLLNMDVMLCSRAGVLLLLLRAMISTLRRKEWMRGGWATLQGVPL